MPGVLEAGFRATYISSLIHHQKADIDKPDPISINQVVFFVIPA
ncbi:MAG: hypothetical protein HW384_1480 [Dehalococcoidia bacterium]|nr:hypothetical protein [Dehalococcoidia bacterium]